MTAQNLVDASGVSLSFDAATGHPVHALRDVELTIASGEVVALTGPSGSGKSTLLHLLGAMLGPDRGRISVAGRDITRLSRSDLVAYRRSVGFVFQRFQLLPALSAVDNVIAPVLPYRRARVARPVARDLLTSVGLADKSDATPAKLSGGQQQRVAIARALINDPQLLLADEPTGNLDTDTGIEILGLLLQRRTDDRLTIVIATHDPAVAARCDRTIHLHDGALAPDVV